MALLTKKRQSLSYWVRHLVQVTEKIWIVLLYTAQGRNNCFNFFLQVSLPVTSIQKPVCFSRHIRHVTLFSTEGWSPQLQREGERTMQSPAQGVGVLEQRCLSVMFYLLAQIKETSAKIYPGSSSCCSCLLAPGNFWSVITSNILYVFF